MYIIFKQDDDCGHVDLFVMDEKRNKQKKQQDNDKKERKKTRRL